MQNKRQLPDREAVTYSGKIPCADCAGQRIVLTLFPDATFRLRQTYLGVLNGRDKDFYDLGRTEKSYPVLIEADHLALERAYLSMRTQPGESIQVTFKGRFVQRMPEPGLPVREHLIVEQFDRVLPGKTCTEMTADADLFETHWYPFQIEGQVITLEPNQREPYFVLSAEDNRVSGFTGCNRLTGGFEMSTGFFRFTALATTRMACLAHAMELETAFLSALNAINSYQIIGNTLALKDDHGVVRMRLKAKNLH